MAEKALADMLELIKLRDKILADEISIRNMITWIKYIIISYYIDWIESTNYS